MKLNGSRRSIVAAAKGKKTKPSIKVADRLLIGQVITNPNGLRNLAKHHGRYAPRRSECAYQTSFLSLDAGACFIDGLWTLDPLRSPTHKCKIIFAIVK